MDARSIAKLIALGRVVFGVVFMAAPEQAGQAWIGDAGRGTGSKLFLRGLGARDLVLGAGALAALGGNGSARNWVVAGAAADAADLAGTLSVRDDLSDSAVAATVAITVGGVLLGAWTATALD